MNQIPKGIYFSAFAGSGKSYCVSYLEAKYNALRAKIANPVYDIARQYFAMEGKDRALLQQVGTVARDMISENIWINRFAEDLDIVTEVYYQMYDKKPMFCSDDCRYVNEHRMLKEMGWQGIWLNVPEDIRRERLIKRDGSAQEETLNHPSELAMNEFKNELIQLDASGSVEDTYHGLDFIIEDLMKGTYNESHQDQS